MRVENNGAANWLLPSLKVFLNVIDRWRVPKLGIGMSKLLLAASSLTRGDGLHGDPPYRTRVGNGLQVQENDSAIDARRQEALSLSVRHAGKPTAIFGSLLPSGTHITIRHRGGTSMTGAVLVSSADLKGMGVRPHARSSTEVRNVFQKILGTGTILFHGSLRELRKGHGFYTNTRELECAFRMRHGAIHNGMFPFYKAHELVPTGDGTLLCGPLPIVPVMTKRNIHGSATDGFVARQNLALDDIDTNKLNDLKNVGIEKSFLLKVEKGELQEIANECHSTIRWEGARPWIDEFDRSTQWVINLQRAIYLYLKDGFRKSDNHPYRLLVGYQNCLLDASIAFRSGKIKDAAESPAEVIQGIQELGETQVGTATNWSLRKHLAERYDLVVDEEKSKVQLDNNASISEGQEKWLKNAFQPDPDKAALNHERLHVFEETPIWTQTGAYRFCDKRKSRKQFPVLEVTFETYFAFVNLYLGPDQLIPR